MRAILNTRVLFWIGLVTFCVVWLYGLGARVLVPTDEGRYAEMAREMVATGNWVTTRLNGIKYFEKPPLQVWMNALTFELFGLGEWQARLWTGLCGLFGVAAVAFTGNRLFGPGVGRNAALVLGSSVLWAMLGHINTLDMGLSAMMTLALCALLLAQHDDASAAEQRNWMLWCWAGMALAVMSKGLIGIVLPGAVLFIYTFVARDWAIWKRLHIGAGLLVFFLITTPWFVLVSLDNPEFPHFFFIHEHLQRFTSKIHHRAGPLYYFLPILLLGMVPWLGVLVQGVLQGVRNAPGAFQPKKMLLVWAAFIFFFFSISSSKLPSYILPIFPALALLLACYLERVSQRVLLINAALLAALGIVGLALLQRVPLLANTPFELPLYQAYLPWIAAASAIAACGGAFAMLLTRRHTTAAIAVTAFAGFLAGQCLMLGHDPLGRYAAGYNLVAAVKAELTPQTRMYAVQRYEQSLPFYLQRTTKLVAHADELEFGLQQQPELWIPKLDDFVAQWRAEPGKAIAIIRPDVYLDLQKVGLPMRVIGADPRRVIVTNQLQP
jgi:4-amino-4-deoxy-L-arabinose transferase-like glycosyltransferase